MALPKLNETPRYTMTIPSTGLEVKFRPWLVKEEKIMLIASESNDMEMAVQAISDTVEACVSEGMDVNTLSTFDLEYMFLKIRSKSVGERVELSFPCGNCDHPVPFFFDMDEIKVDKADFDRTVEITDTVSLSLRWPSYANIDMKTDNLGFEMITACIEAVCTEEERILLDDEPREDVRAFLENLTTEQFSKIAKVVESIPKVYFEIDETCSACQSPVKQRVEGLQNFFQ